MPFVGGQRYLTSTAVFMNEVIKLTICLTVALFELSRNIAPTLPATSLFGGAISAVFTGDSWKMAIPASLYVLQNSLQYLAISNLDSATYQVTYQFRILPTAVLSVLMMNMQLCARKWMALGLLMVGIIFVQLPASGSSAVPFKGAQPGFYIPRSLDAWRNVGGAAVHHIYKRSATYEGIAEDEGLLHPQMNTALGLTATIAGCTASAGASVYFEKILKTSDTHVSLWIRNTQLAFYSLFPTLFIGVMFVDGEIISQHGFFVGYSPIVWLTVTLQSIGGILVSMCILYADNIVKNFAFCISILISLCASIWIFDFAMTTNVILVPTFKHHDHKLTVMLQYLIGTFIVVFATWLYNINDSSQERSLRPPPVRIYNYEKTNTERARLHENDAPRKTPTADLKSLGLSSSRPSSPGHHHSRIGSSRQYFGNKDKD